jgi:hypothetical protein
VQVIMSTPSRQAHQQIIERTRDLSVRAANLSTSVAALVQEQTLFIKNRHA